MYSRVHPTTLHHHVVAVRHPRLLQRGLNDGSAVSATAQIGVGDDILQEAMSPSLAKQVPCCDEHASRSDAAAIIGNKDMDALLGKGFLPDALGMISRMSGGAYFRNGKEREQRGQIGSESEAGSRQSCNGNQ